MLTAWRMKERYWLSIDSTSAPSTIASATLLGSRGEVRMLEPPHTEENYLLKEMGFRIARKHRLRLRGITRLAGFALPATASFLALLLGGLSGGIAAGRRHMLDDLRPYIYRSTDGGRAWQSISGNLPANAYVWVVREDPKNPKLIYAKGFLFLLTGGQSPEARAARVDLAGRPGFQRELKRGGEVLRRIDVGVEEVDHPVLRLQRAGDD